MLAGTEARSGIAASNAGIPLTRKACSAASWMRVPRRLVISAPAIRSRGLTVRMLAT